MTSVRHAVILAAGLGTRLKSVVDDRPKGLIEIGGEPLVGRSVRLLRARGIEAITIVVGHCADAYRAFAANEADIRLAANDAFAATGSMASLAIALDAISEPIVVLESDLLYESRALDALLNSSAPDATLLSGPTGAGDEVWVWAPGGRLDAMSKQLADLPGATGEFVGITRLSRGTCVAMREAFAKFHHDHRHGRMDYETGALVSVARERPIATVLVPDLCWGEIDDDRQLARVVNDVWPVVSARERSR